MDTLDIQYIWIKTLNEFDWFYISHRLPLSSNDDIERSHHTG
jgi:hypothetical protein